MPMDHWLNVWCIWHTKVETIQEFRSHCRIGWVIQDFRETYVSRSLTFHLESKMPWRQTPSIGRRVYNCDDECLSGSTKLGFSKVWEIFKVCGIESFKHVRDFYTPVCYCGNISTPQNVILNETNCDWLFDMSIKRPHGWALVNECCHVLQTFSHQSEGLATWDLLKINRCVNINPPKTLQLK